MGNLLSKLNLKCCVGLKKKTDKHKEPVEEETTDPDSVQVAITGKQGQPHQQDFGDALCCNSGDGYAANSGASQELKCPKQIRENPNKEKKSVKSNKKYLKEKSSHRKHHKKRYQYDSDSSTDSSDSFEDGGIGHVRTQIIENAKIVNIGKGNKVIDRSKTITYNVTSQSDVPTKTKADTKPTQTAVNTSVGGWAGFRKQVDDKRTARGIQLRIKASESVGIIRGRGTVGTGFLVGNRHIMTALHVIKDLKDISGEHLKPERAKELSIQFRYLSFVDNNRPENFFYFQQNIAYENVALDVVVLELQPIKENQTLPKPLKYFSPIHSNWDASMYGHPGGEVLQEDPGIKIFNLMPEMLKEAKEWSIQNFHANGYHGIEDNRKILFHCLFGKGASGSPGLYAPEYLENASVVWMLIRGYPGFHYEKDHDQYKVRDEYLIEQGVTMTSIWEDMKRTNPGLCKKIFGDQDLSPIRDN